MPTFNSEEYNNVRASQPQEPAPKQFISSNRFFRALFPPIKYRVLREFVKFGCYLVIPFMVVYVSSQAAIKEMIILKYKRESPFEKPVLDLDERQVLYEPVEDNTFFEKYEENKKRIQHFLELQKQRQQQEK